MTRAAIYARYSSDNQREASIEDQVRVCRALLAREGWACAEVYADHGISGATTLRPGYQAMLADARAGRFTTVVAESLDRLSRDQEDVAALYKHLGFADVALVTVAEGRISELHVGLKGTMNALYLKDLAQKTRRGLEGRVRAGKSGGGNAYGYEVVRTVAPDGTPVRGERRINESEAETVQRIFREFAAGRSPLAIARALNAEGVLGPRGRRWGDTTIRGHATRRTGILHNDLYAGRLVWNRQRYVKDPRTGKRLARPNPESDWVVQDVPDLRIVDEDLWDRVQSRLNGIRQSPRVEKARATRFWEKRRARHLLTGLVRCGACGSSFAAVGRDYLACPSARKHGTCDNRRGIRRMDLEGLILAALKDNLMQPDAVKAFAAAFHEEINRAEREQERRRETRRRELAQVAARLDGLLEAIADGLRSPGLMAKLQEPVIHPNAAEAYRRAVAHLHETLRREDSRDEALDILRGLIEAVVIHPAEGGFEIELIGAIANMVALAGTTNARKAASYGTAVPDRFLCSVKVVAGARNCLHLLVFVRGLQHVRFR